MSKTDKEEAIALYQYSEVAMVKFPESRAGPPHAVKILPWVEYNPNPVDMSEKLQIDSFKKEDWNNGMKDRIEIVARMYSKYMNLDPREALLQVQTCTRVQFVSDDQFLFFHEKVGVDGFVTLVFRDQELFKKQSRAAEKQGDKYVETTATVKDVVTFVICGDRGIRSVSKNAKDHVLMLPLMLKIFMAGPTFQPKTRLDQAALRLITHPNEGFKVDEMSSHKLPMPLCGGGCGKLGRKWCGSCRCVSYCDSKCQKAHWCVHKGQCDKLWRERKAGKGM